jgi:hypothetical protein
LEVITRQVGGGRTIGRRARGLKRTDHENARESCNRKGGSSTSESQVNRRGGTTWRTGRLTDHLWSQPEGTRNFDFWEAPDGSTQSGCFGDDRGTTDTAREVRFESASFGRTQFAVGIGIRTAGEPIVAIEE